MGTITVSPKALADSLAGVKPAVNTKSANRALAGVLISNWSYATYLNATDADVYVTRKLPSEREGGVPPDVLVSHAELVKVAKAFAGRESVTLEPVTDGCTNVTAVACSNGSRKITIPTLPTDNFPARPRIGGELIIQRNAKDLRTAILKADVFRSHDDTRPVLTGLHLTNGYVEVTDSYRLLRMVMPSDIVSEHDAVVSGRGFTLAAKQMPKDDTEVQVFTYATHTVIQWAGTTWISRNIVGQYPNTSQLWPDEHLYEHTITGGREQLLAGANLGKQLLTDKKAPLCLTANGDVRITGETLDAASFAETIEDATVTHHNATNMEITIGLNPGFFADIMANIGSERVRINLISPLRPALVESCDSDERHLIMPIRLNV